MTKKDINELKNKKSNAVASFWSTRQKQGNVLVGKQLDAFLHLLSEVAQSAGVPKECIHLDDNHVPGYFRVTKRLGLPDCLSKRQPYCRHRTEIANWVVLK